MPSLEVDSNLVHLLVIQLNLTTDKDGLDRGRALLKCLLLDSRSKDYLLQPRHHLNKLKHHWTP